MGRIWHQWHHLWTKYGKYENIWKGTSQATDLQVTLCASPIMFRMKIERRLRLGKVARVLNPKVLLKDIV